MLRFVEEILLLLLRDDDGKFVNVPQSSMDRAIAGAVLMELAMENRIDTDLENLILVDATPLGDDLLDSTLAMIAEGSEDQKDARHWVEQTARQAPAIREATLDRLVERGILEREDDRFLWVFRSRRYPMVDGQAEREVKLRIMGVLFSNEIPSPPRRGGHLPGPRLRHLRRAAVQAGAGAGRRAHRAGAQARPHRPGHDPVDPGLRDVAGQRRCPGPRLLLGGTP